MRCICINYCFNLKNIICYLLSSRGKNVKNVKIIRLLNIKINNEIRTNCSKMKNKMNNLFKKIIINNIINMSK